MRNCHPDERDRSAERGDRAAEQPRLPARRIERPDRGIAQQLRMLRRFDRWIPIPDDEPVRPTDPVLLRLFPDGYQDDGEAASDFRRFTERGLREAKSGTAATVLASLATAEGVDPAGHRAKDRNKTRVELDPAEADAWLRTLTDLRLALGTRLGVTEGDESVWAALPDDDPRRHIHDVYDWLGWLQETLVRTLSAGLG
jgi:hypothetical protein